MLKKNVFRVVRQDYIERREARANAPAPKPVRAPYRPARRWAAGALAACMLLTLLPTAAGAAEDSGFDTITITGFDVLEEAVQYQTVPSGTGIDSLTLPYTLRATVCIAAPDLEPAEIQGVYWEPDSPWDETAEQGGYVFTPILPEAYTLAQDVEPPELYVRVEGRPAPMNNDGTPKATLDFLHEPGGRQGEGWSWEEATKTLTLKGASLEGPAVGNMDTSVCAVLLPPGASLVLEGENTISTKSSIHKNLAQNYGIYGVGKLTIRGEGTLTVESGNASFFSAGIGAAEIVLEGAAALDCTAGNADTQSVGLWATTGAFTMKGNSSFVAKSGEGTNAWAVSPAPTLPGTGKNIISASTNADGTPIVSYDAENIQTYRYLSVAVTPEYHPDDVAAINAMIDNNGLKAKKDDPEGWGTSGILTWNNATPKKITQLKIGGKSLTGALNVSGLTSLISLSCFSNQLTALTGLGSLENLISLDCSGNQLEALTGLGNLEKLTTLNCYNNKLTALTGLGNLTNMTALSCYGNQLTSLDVSTLTKLTTLGCSSNQLEALTGLGRLENLTSLYCQNNQLTSLDVSTLTKLTTLNCSSNQLEALTGLGSLTELTNLSCQNNKLTELPDLGSLESLTDLNCFGNRLEALTGLDSLTELTDLYCYNNKLTELPDLSSLASLSILKCANNELTALTGLGNLTNLTVLDCSRNQLEALTGLGSLENLFTLYCQINKLTELSGLGSLTELAYFNCSSNQVEELAGLDTLTKLASLSCQNNKLTELDVSNLKQLTALSCANNPITSLRLSDSLQLTVGSAEGGMVILSGYSYTSAPTASPSLTLDAIPDNSHIFKNWKAMGTSLDGNTEYRVEFILDGEITITPVYENKEEAANAQAVAAAKVAIEGGTYTAAQVDAETQDALKTALAQQINALDGMTATGITVTEDNITITAFTAATPGDANKPDGDNGSYTFTVSLTKGLANANTDSKDGTITATRYTNSGGGSSGSGGSNTTTTTTTNPDGSKTTTVKNKATGAVTETTKAGDGTVTVIETNKDGDQTYTQQRPDGTEISAQLPKSGGTTARVTLPEHTEAVVSFPAADGTVVLRVLPDGTEEPVAYSLVEGGRVYVRLEGDAELRVETRSGLFDDMDGHWAEDSADFTGARALFQGTAERTFTPEQPMTRGMLVTVLYRLDGAPPAGEAAFSDVARGDWYAGGVAWASENGISGGIGGGLFGTGRSVTRQELAVMLWNYARYDGLDVSAGEDINILSYTDIDEASEWAIPALQWACGAGILQGDKNGALNPTGSATRAEAAAMLERLITASVK